MSGFASAHCDSPSEKEAPSPDPFRVAVDEANDKTLLDEAEHSVCARHGVFDLMFEQVVVECHLNYRNENPCSLDLSIVQFF